MKWVQLDNNEWVFEEDSEFIIYYDEGEFEVYLNGALLGSFGTLTEAKDEAEEFYQKEE